MLPRLAPRNSAITFDLGAGGVRAFQWRAAAGHLRVRDALRLEFPPSPQEPPATVTPDYERLGRLVGQAAFAGRDVALVLSPPSVRFHTLRMPEQALTQSEERVRAALAFEVSREARCEPHELEVRYWRLPRGHHQGLNVMAVSMPAQAALEYAARFAEHGLHLRRIDVAPCALVRLASQMCAPAERDLWAVLDLGQRQSVLTVVVGVTPAYVRVLPISGAQWSQRIASAFEVSPAEGDEIKRRHGLHPGSASDAPEAEADLASLNPTSEADVPRVVLGLLHTSLQALVREIDVCCSYVVQSYSDLNVSRLVLAGGGANLPGLMDYLSLYMGIPVLRLTAEESAHWHSSPGDARVTAESAAAAGAALLDLEAA